MRKTGGSILVLHRSMSHLSGARRAQPATPSDTSGVCELLHFREHGYCPVRDGTRLAYVCWRPSEQGQFPTIVSFSPYSSSGVPFDRIRRFVEAGYAYVGANVRGTGCSEGEFSYYHPIEGNDGAQLIEWAAAQPWSSGDVGMVGISYAGHTQIKVAACKPPHLRAIVPVSTEGSEYHDEGMTGGIFNAALLGLWSFENQPELASNGVAERVVWGDSECEAIRARQADNRSFYEALQHPFYDAWWRERSLDRLASEVDVPTLLINAWQDEWIRPNGAGRLFNLIRSEHKRLIYSNGAHAIGALDIVRAEEMRWLDRWLKRDHNGAERDPSVTVLWETNAADGADRSTARPGWTTQYSSWPPYNIRWMPLYLTVDGRLDTDQPSDETDESVRTYLYPLGTELVGSEEQFALSSHPLGTLSYRTEQVEVDTAVLGSPQLTVYFSCEQPDTDFLFTLKDVDAVERTLFLQRTVMRASMRAIDEQLTTDDEIIQCFRSEDRLTPGRIYNLKLSLTTIGHVLRAGHRLELSILAPATIPGPIWGFAPVPMPSVNRIYHSAEYPSQMLLPIAFGEHAQAEPPRTGALENQPVRQNSSPA